MNSLDNLNDLQDTLLALAVYDWRKFNDMRIYRLKKDYNLKTSNYKILEYYYGRKPSLMEIKHKRYVKKHKEYLNAILYN